MRDVRCKGCDRLLFKTEGAGTKIEIVCHSCRRVIVISANNEQTIKDTRKAS